ncbi:unnamed protein product [marine sediment metagenome]|uniref:YCII-related domain-containing protein n=1 Tax=marine sediment metagenome TaxID=412755 RepID=X0TVP5_9ZZZZ
MCAYSKQELPIPEEGFLVVENSSSDLSGFIDFFPTKKEAETHVKKMCKKETPEQLSNNPFYIIPVTRFIKKQS